MTDEAHIYIGTYTKKQHGGYGRAEGIYVYKMDSAGHLEHLSTSEPVPNPSFLAIDAEGRHLYAVLETGNYKGKSGGGVAAYDIDPEDGTLSLVNTQSSEGAGPCHINIIGQWAIVANYAGGSVSVLPILEDGGLGEAVCFIQHGGASINKSRQAGPHAHNVTISPDGRRIFVCDLGVDKIMIYNLDSETGQLSRADPPWVKIQAGQGPRHLTFHPDGERAYLINELGSTITTFAYAEGYFNPLQTVSTLPDGFQGENTCADIHAHPSGKFLYGSNRGHDSIAIFAVDAEAGTLTPIGHESTQGRTPRNFTITPDGRFLLAANQDTDTVVPFKIDASTGELKAVGHGVSVPTPVCLLMS
jgi:6-phosphogluconolactonase